MHRQIRVSVVSQVVFIFKKFSYERMYSALVIKFGDFLNTASVSADAVCDIVRIYLDISSGVTRVLFVAAVVADYASGYEWNIE